MYRIRVHSVSANAPVNTLMDGVVPAYLKKRRNVFLDICAETGQITRRVLLGALKCPDEVIFIDEPTHVTDSHLSLNLVCGNTILGRHTIIDLGPISIEKRSFTYARRNTPVYKLSFSIEPVQFKYSFSLDTITCLKQNRWLSPDPLFAEVEFNHNIHNVTVQPTNRYSLGYFQQHDTSFAYSSHHLSFCTMNPFLISFHTKRFVELLLEKWAFGIKIENNNEFITLDVNNHQELIRFENVDAITKTITIKNNTCSYALKFTITRTPVETDIPFEESEEAITKQYLDSERSSRTFSEMSGENDVEICIDGLQTFGRYYHYMMQATESIDILGWELSLSFGLYYKTDRDISDDSMLARFFKRGRWVTLRDVLLLKAAGGVRIRIMIWRHRLLSYANRLMYMGEVTIEREVKKLQMKAKQMGLKVVVFHTDFNLPDANSKYADPFIKFPDANIVFIIVGNPKGLVSCHHEKLLLIDAELPNRCVAFMGGFDMARGRFDQPLHLPPLPLWDFSNILSQKPGRYGDSTIQPFFRNIRFLWHDNQIFIRGPATRVFHLHFVQRWSHAFTGDNHGVRIRALPIFTNGGQPMNDPPHALIHKAITLRVLRSWPGVFSTHTLLDNFITLISNAHEFLYIEHQYPFHDVSLTQALCERLRVNTNLKVIVIMPVKSDLPSGIVGSWLDMSQDQIFENLEIIYNIAPERVGVFGLVRQEEKTKTIKSIYIHSKLMIVDDKILCCGSANMDNLSFQQSSEYNVNIFSETICKETKERLVKEHLEYWNPSFNEFANIFKAFRKIGDANLSSILRQNIVMARPVPLVPSKSRHAIVDFVNYPNPIAKMMFKMGLQPDQFLRRLVSNLEVSANDENVDDARNAFFLQSML